MTDKTEKKEAMFVKIIIFLIGLLIGLGTAYATTIADVRTNTVKIDMMSRSVDANQKTIIETLDLVKCVVNQNSLLINSVISEKKP